MRLVRAGLVIAAALLIAAVVLLASGPVDAFTSNRVVHGDATTYGPGYNGYIALPEGPGHYVKICSRASGVTRCVWRTSNDAGPSLAGQRLGRVVDLDVSTFEYLCKCSWQTGVIGVTVEYLPSKGRAATQASDSGAHSPIESTLPPTDTAGG